ncbi:MAG: CinA family protein [Alphaproteobacteria bacterium]|nr:CinA family protein [Alphaproteobacteria bacterium]
MFDESLMILAERVLEDARGKGFTIATAESCTGGLVASLLTEISGSSDVVMGGAVTYSNQAKLDLLNVNPLTLETDGAVSKETVLQMAKGAAKAYRADVAVSLSGVAGPTGGTDTKPVGLVWVGLHYGGQGTAFQHHFRGDRLQIRLQAVEAALTHIYEALNPLD